MSVFLNFISKNAYINRKEKLYDFLFGTLAAYFIYVLSAQTAEKTTNLIILLVIILFTLFIFIGFTGYFVLYKQRRYIALGWFLVIFFVPPLTPYVYGILQGISHQYYHVTANKIKFCETAAPGGRFDHEVSSFLISYVGPKVEVYHNNIGRGPNGCFMKLAVDEKNENYCQNIPKKTIYPDTDRNECYLLTAIKKQDKDTCDLIDNQAITSHCYLALALSKNDGSFCEMIKTLSYRTDENVNYPLIDSNICKSEIKKRNP